MTASGPGRPAAPMSAQFNAELENQLFQALACDCGLCIRTNDPAEYLRRAYIVKRRVADRAPELESLAFKRSPLQPDRVWIIRAEALQGQSVEPSDSQTEPKT